MKTYTIMINHSRRFPTPSPVDPTIKKRKERERDSFEILKPKLAKLSQSSSAPAQQAACKNQLLAGYLAHEFLTKGTLFGKPSRDALESAKSLKPDEAVSLKAEPKMEFKERYDQVADLLKTEKAHLPGIVNPAQLPDSFISDLAHDPN